MKSELWPISSAYRLLTPAVIRQQHRKTHSVKFLQAKEASHLYS
jgi:hypothetical protein